jgi:hypothetical protein
MKTYLLTEKEISWLVTKGYNEGLDSQRPGPDDLDRVIDNCLEELNEILKRGE